MNSLPAHLAPYSIVNRGGLAGATKDMTLSGCIGEIKVHTARPRADEARRLLQRVADQVQPIMRAHGWRVASLQEFFPKNGGLLGMNVNRGGKILVRLRPARLAVVAKGKIISRSARGDATLSLPGRPGQVRRRHALP